MWELGGTISRAERAKFFFDPPPLWFTCGEHEIDQDTYFLKELEALIFFPALKD